MQQLLEHSLAKRTTGWLDEQFAFGFTGTVLKDAHMPELRRIMSEPESDAAPIKVGLLRPQEDRCDIMPEPESDAAPIKVGLLRPQEDRCDIMPEPESDAAPIKVCLLRPQEDTSTSQRPCC
jgi:hypothetical protein